MGLLLPLAADEGVDLCRCVGHHGDQGEVVRGIDDDQQLLREGFDLFLVVEEPNDVG
jgi:hypothetical protein